MGNPQLFLPLVAALGLWGCGDGWDSADPNRWVDNGDDREPDAAVADPADKRHPGRTFFVSRHGDDEASGRALHRAWRTLARVNLEQLSPGDEVLFEGGASFAGTLRIDAADGGDPHHPVRVSSFGGPRATIDAGEADGIVIDNAEGVIIERLNVTGGWQADEQIGNEGEGVSVIGSVSGDPRVFLRLRELDVSGFKLAGIGLHARPEDESKDSGYRDVEIRDCEIHDNGDFGVVSDGPYIYDGPGYSHSRVRVRNVRAYSNLGLKDKGAHTGSGIVLSDVDDAVIEYSVAYENGALNDHTAGGGFGIWAWDSNRVVIQYNEAYDNDSMTADGGGFDLDGGVTNSVMRWNYSHGNQGAGFGAFQFEWARPYSGNLIYYNISQDDGVAFLVWDGNGDMGSLDYAHNIGYGEGPIVETYSPLADVGFFNNVFYGLGPELFDVMDASSAGLTLQGNAYWTGDVPFRIVWGGASYADFEAYREATGNERYEGSATGLYVDPLLVAAGTGPTLDDPRRLSTLDMYRLTAESPLIDRGVSLEEFGVQVVDNDFFGEPVPRGAAPDIGVHELDMMPD